MDAPLAGAKRPREDPLLKQLAARLAATAPPILAATLAERFPGGAAAVLALLPAAAPDSQLAALQKAADAIGKAAQCKFSSSNAFSLGRARPAISAFTKLMRAGAKSVTDQKDAAAVAAWATGALDVASSLWYFDAGLTDYDTVAKGIAGKAAAAALRGAWGKGASAEVRQALAAAAAHAPAKEDKE